MQDIADVYARSLFQVAVEQNKLDEIHDQLDEFSDALAESRELQMYFFSPYFTSVEKKDGIEKVVKDGNEYFVRFLQLLAERHRLPATHRIRREFDDRWAEQNKLLTATITSAVELDKKTANSIKKQIEQQVDRKVELTTEVDPDILGGLRVQVGNQIIDASVRTKLDRLRRQVAQAA